jgi:hypothetical protein
VPLPAFFVVGEDPQKISDEDPQKISRKITGSLCESKIIRENSRQKSGGWNEDAQVFRMIDKRFSVGSLSGRISPSGEQSPGQKPKSKALF